MSIFRDYPNYKRWDTPWGRLQQSEEGIYFLEGLLVDEEYAERLIKEAEE